MTPGLAHLLIAGIEEDREWGSKSPRLATATSGQPARWSSTTSNPAARPNCITARITPRRCLDVERRRTSTVAPAALSSVQLVVASRRNGIGDVNRIGLPCAPFPADMKEFRHVTCTLSEFGSGLDPPFHAPENIRRAPGAHVFRYLSPGTSHDERNVGLSPVGVLGGRAFGVTGWVGAA